MATLYAVGRERPVNELFSLNLTAMYGIESRFVHNMLNIVYNSQR